MLQRPVVVALFLTTAYYAVVAAVQAARSRRSNHAFVGAAILAGLTTAATIWA